MPDNQPATIHRHVVERARSAHPGDAEALGRILAGLALAAKRIARELAAPPPANSADHTGERNVHGERVRRLDRFAHDAILRAVEGSGALRCMVSEESEELLPVPAPFPAGEHVLLFDPLDGSSNLGVNVPVGTIFSVHRALSGGERGTLEDCLQPGVRQVAAGYALYGPATTFVYTSGSGVDGFTLDPAEGEFRLSHPRMRIPEPPKRYYSVNEAYYPRWSPGQRRFVDRLKESGRYSSRYVGSLVADFHRTLLAGGIFMYPADGGNPRGKLRLLYEAAPLALVCERAGGAASDGRRPILGVVPGELHGRTPLYLGSRALVGLAGTLLGEDSEI